MSKITTESPAVNPQELFWHRAPWQEITNRLRANKLPHALLLSGPAGLGKSLFAETLAHTILCQQSRQAMAQWDLDSGFPAPCGQCHSCQLIQAGNHPDILIVSPESKGKSINVDQVRNIAHFLSLKSHSSLHQVVLLEPAENMNHFAANSLLKTLEEPTANCVLLLISHKPSLLLPTIRSRCQNLNFTAPEKNGLFKWLRQREAWSEDQLESLMFISNGAPLHALEYGHTGTLQRANEVLADFQALATRKQEPVSIAKKWVDMEIPLIYQWLISWVGAMIRLKSCSRLPDNNPVVVAQLQNLADQVNLDDLFAYFDKVMECYNLLNTQANSQLLLEDCLIFWRRINNCSA